MDWNRVEGNWKQLKGKVKEQWGKLTDDDLDVIAGKRDQLEGKIQERYGIEKDKVKTSAVAPNITFRVKESFQLAATPTAAPMLVRSSGFSDFDAAAVAAIQRAAPFEPLPPSLAPELDRLSLLIPVAFANPMVQ